MQSKSPTVHHSSQKQQDGSRRVIQFVTAKKSVNASISAVAASNENKKEQFVFSSPNPGTAAKTPSTKQNSQNPSSTPLNGDKKCNAGVVGTASINTETGLFPMNVVTKYLRWNSLHRVGPGFHNEGNTCFLNSTLQCLLYLAPFSQCLLDESALALKNISKANTDERKHERTVIELYNNLVKDVWQGSHAGRAIAPKGMISCIRRVGKQFKPFRQEDAHEYLRQLLDCMHEEILKFNRLKTSDGKKAETSVVSRVFGGYLCNTLTCTRCQYTSKTYNHFQDLSLEIRQGINSVSDAIQAFTKIENLTQGNEWKCDGCKNKVKATKQLTIQEPPNVLVLHLKRFSFGNMFGKISKHIEFTERLNVPFNNSGRSNKDASIANYELTGVVVHHGHSTHSGHYIAYVKAPNGQWHEMNDSSVSIASMKKVLQAQGYLLFYTRIPNPSEIPITPKKVEKIEEAMGLKSVADKTIEKKVEDKVPKGQQTPVKVPATPLISSVPTPARSAIKDQEKSTLDDISDKSDESEDSSYESDDSTFDSDDEEESNGKSFGGTQRYRIKLPLRFSGPLKKFRRWKSKRVLTDLYILGRILKLKALHDNSGRSQDKEDDEDPSSKASTSDEEIESDSDSDSDEMSTSSGSNDGKDAAVSTSASSAPSQKTGGPTNATGGDVLSALLEQSRRGRNIGGEGVWDSVSTNEKEKISQLAVQQRRKDQDEKRKTRLSDWDMQLDQGRVKKVKTKHETDEETPGEKFSPFQKVLDERNEQKQKYGKHMDLREEPTFKHSRKDSKQHGRRDFDQNAQHGGKNHFKKNNNFQRR